MRGKEKWHKCVRRSGRKEEGKDRGGVDVEVSEVGEEGFNRWETQGKE